MTRVALPLTAIFAVQSIITMGSYGISVVAPDAAADIGMSRERFGVVVSTIYLVAMITGLLTGVLVARLGPTRLFQCLLLSAAAGVGLTIASRTPALALAGAALIGCATGPMNPLGSHVLSRIAPTRWRALVFSVKQCATPAGGMLAGAILPALVVAYDWRVALSVVPLAALVLAALAPWGGLGTSETGKSEGATGVLAGTWASLRVVLSGGPIRAVALTGMCFAACQLALSTYLVFYLRDVVGLPAAAAGATFAVLHVAGIGARIALGFLADRVIPADRLLTATGVVMAASLALIAGFSTGWPTLGIVAVTAAMGASGNGWVGLFFLELAKASPPGRTAEVAGGGQFVMYAGIVGGPLLFGGLLSATGRYETSLIVLAAVAAVAAIGPMLARSRSR